MTLEEALVGHDWIPDMKNGNRARIAGPDNKAAIMVEEDGDGMLHCWLWSALVRGQLGDVVVETDADGLEDALQELVDLRQSAGDCPKCERPLHPMRDESTRCVCGYQGSLSAAHVVEVLEMMR